MGIKEGTGKKERKEKEGAFGTKQESIIQTYITPLLKLNSTSRFSSSEKRSCNSWGTPSHGEEATFGFLQGIPKQCRRLSHGTTGW